MTAACACEECQGKKRHEGDAGGADLPPLDELAVEPDALEGLSEAQLRLLVEALAEDRRRGGAAETKGGKRDRGTADPTDYVAGLGVFHRLGATDDEAGGGDVSPRVMNRRPEVPMTDREVPPIVNRPSEQAGSTNVEIPPRIVQGKK